jgi:hypothetical protein
VQAVAATRGLRIADPDPAHGEDNIRLDNVKTRRRNGRAPGRLVIRDTLGLSGLVCYTCRGGKWVEEKVV